MKHLFTQSQSRRIAAVVMSSLCASSVAMAALIGASSCAAPQAIEAPAPTSVAPPAAPKPTEPAAQPPAVQPAVLSAALSAATGATADGLEAAAERAVGWWTLPQQPSYAEILDPKRSPEGFDKTMSVGSVAHGRLANAVALEPTGPGWSIIERHRDYGTSYGTRELHELIRRAAGEVTAAHGGAPLRIGNMSRRGGGDIRWSNSHNSGRDADLAFYVVDAETGESVPAPDLLSFDDQGRTPGHAELRFDVVRNWALVRAMLEDPHTTIQWIFISEGLKAMLLDHARAQAEPEELIERASHVLHQPTDALPHDDHFHLRIACPRVDRLEGCLDYGPKWAWGDWHEDDLLARSLALMEAMDDRDPQVRMAALERLEAIDSPYAGDVALMRGAWDDDAQIRERAMQIARGSWRWSPAGLRAAQALILAPETDAEQTADAYAILRRSVDPLARDFAIARLSDPAVDDAEKALAARALSHFMEPELVPVLIKALGNCAPAVQAEVAEVLARITNHREGLEWRRASVAERAAGITKWGLWWASNQDKNRDHWLLAGFQAHGVAVETLERVETVDELVHVLRDAPEHVVYNVNCVLRRVTGRWAPLEQVDGEKLFAYWNGWWRKNRERMADGGAIFGGE